MARLRNESDAVSETKEAVIAVVVKAVVVAVVVVDGLFSLSAHGPVQIRPLSVYQCRLRPRDSSDYVRLC